MNSFPPTVRYSTAELPRLIDDVLSRRGEKVAKPAPQRGWLPLLSRFRRVPVEPRSDTVRIPQS